MNPNIINGKLVMGRRTSDGKRAFMGSDTNNGWQDLRIEIDTDDCDSEYALEWAQRIIDCVNACAGTENLENVRRCTGNG